MTETLLTEAQSNGINVQYIDTDLRAPAIKAK